LTDSTRRLPTGRPATGPGRPGAPSWAPGALPVARRPRRRGASAGRHGALQNRRVSADDAPES